jgi:hypothetical protein
MLCISERGNGGHAAPVDVGVISVCGVRNDSFDVDQGLNLLHNFGMSTGTIPTAIDDMHAVSEAFLAGRAVDPEVARRLHERAAELRQRLIAEHGLQDISVPLLRQARETGP